MKKIFALAVLVLLGVSACSWFPYRPSSNESALFQVLDNSVGGEASVDFSEIIDGTWSRMLIVCNGTTQSQLESALGFSWLDSPDLGDSNFSSMLVFANEESVASRLGPERDESGTKRIFTPCTPTALGGTSAPPVLELTRSDTTMTLTLEETFFGRPVWYPEAAETARLSSVAISAN